MQIQVHRKYTRETKFKITNFNIQLLIFHISKATDCTLKRNKRVHPLPVTINLLICIKYNLIAKYQIRRYIMALTNITHLFSNGEGAS